MTTYANAAPPPGALFDNAPAEPFPAVTMTTTTGHLIPATRICQARGGRWVAVDVLMQYGSPIPLDLALQRVAIGRTVFVRREDAAAVMGAANGLGVANGETA